MSKRSMALQSFYAAFTDLSPGHIEIRSLATSLHHWTRPAPKVATLQLSLSRFIIPRHRSAALQNEMGPLSVVRLQRPHVGQRVPGADPLNDVEEMDHVFEYAPVCLGFSRTPSVPAQVFQLTVCSCIAISGLASPPIRLLAASRSQTKPCPRVDQGRGAASCSRYETILYGQHSGLIDQPVDPGSRRHCQGPDREPVGRRLERAVGKAPRLSAHSLGGVILKDCFVRIADASDVLNRDIIDKVRGAVMFGVPESGNGPILSARHG